MPQGPRLVAADDGEIHRAKWIDEAAGNASQIVSTRFVIWFLALLAPFAIGLMSYAGNRIIVTLDRAVERQEIATRDMAEVRAQITGNIAVNTANLKTIADRIEESNRVLNDRQNAQATWMQQLANKIEELSRFVYQKVH